MSITRESGTWSKHFMKMALVASEISKDPSTKTGCIIINAKRDIIATGYNGFPFAIDDKDEWLNDRDMKYALVIHAETNAILRTTNRRDLEGAELYCTHYPCGDCAKNIVQVGIKKVFYHNRQKLEDGNWAEHYKVSDMIFKQSGVFTKQVLI